MFVIYFKDLKQKAKIVLMENIQSCNKTNIMSIYDLKGSKYKRTAIKTSITSNWKNKLPNFKSIKDSVFSRGSIFYKGSTATENNMYEEESTIYDDTLSNISITTAFKGNRSKMSDSYDDLETMGRKSH